MIRSFTSFTSGTDPEVNEKNDRQRSGNAVRSLRSLRFHTRVVLMRGRAKPIIILSLQNEGNEVNETVSPLPSPRKISFTSVVKGEVNEVNEVVAA
jgi:hypothetical protein